MFLRFTLLLSFGLFWGLLGSFVVEMSWDLHRQISTKQHGKSTREATKTQTPLPQVS